MNRVRVDAWAEWVPEQCRVIRAAGQWRALRPVDDGHPQTTLTATGQPVVSFASNDYLGLSQHPSVKQAAIAAIEALGTGAGASRLVVGSRPLHAQLEARLAEWRGTEAAVVFPTGYAANTGLLAVLGGSDVTIFSDELNHASLIDGCRMAASRGASVHVYPHRDVEALERQFAGAAHATRALVVTDTVFSMDGDVAPIAELRELTARHGALLVVDDAHKVFPVPGLDDVDDPRVIRVGTLSKLLGSLGGFVAGPRSLVELLVNRARPFIFTTATTPADAAAALAALDVVCSDEGRRRMDVLRRHIDQLRPGHPTPILPVVIGDERDAVRASTELLDAGLLVPAIRPPTVPAGTSRLRVALSALHTDDEVARLRDALAGRW